MSLERMSEIVVGYPLFQHILSGSRGLWTVYTNELERLRNRIASHVDEMLNASWIEAADAETKKWVAEMGMWFVGGFCTGLRGEEMLMIELAGTKHSLVQLTHPVDQHFCFQVLGRTKGRQENGRLEMPCIATTIGTGLKPGRWTRWLDKRRENNW